MDSWLGKTGCPLSPNLIIINAATLSHSPCGLSLSVEYHFVSDPGSRNDQRPAGHLFANRDTSLELAIHSLSLSSLIHHMVSLNIDMKMIRPWNCYGSPILFMDFWTSWTSCNAADPGKISHSNFYRSSVNCVQSSVLWWIFESIQLLFQTVFDVGFWFTFPRQNTESENT